MCKSHGVGPRNLFANTIYGTALKSSVRDKFWPRQPPAKFAIKTAAATSARFDTDRQCRGNRTPRTLGIFDRDAVIQAPPEQSFFGCLGLELVPLLKPPLGVEEILEPPIGALSPKDVPDDAIFVRHLLFGERKHQPAPQIQAPLVWNGEVVIGFQIGRAHV